MNNNYTTKDICDRKDTIIAGKRNQSGEALYDTGQFDTFIGDLKDQQEKDIWRRCYQIEVEFETIDNNPILLPTVKNQLGLDDYPDEIITEAMEGTGLIAKLPLYGSVPVPVSKVALDSVIKRSNFLKESAGSGLTRYDLAEILNKLFKNYGSGFNLALIREGKLTALHSGDESDYTVLPQGDLNEALKEELESQFGQQSIKFLHGYISEMNTSCTLEIQSADCAKEFTGALAAAGLPTNVRTGVIASSSDIAVGAATVQAVIWTGNGNCMYVGRPISLKHRYKTTIDDYRQNVQMVQALYKTSAEGLKELTYIPIWKPYLCIQSVAKRIGIAPKWLITSINGEIPIIERVFDDDSMENNAFKVYYHLWEIIPLMISSGATKQQIFNMQDTLSRALFVNYYEHNVGSFEW